MIDSGLAIAIYGLGVASGGGLAFLFAWLDERKDRTPQIRTFKPVKVRDVKVGDYLSIEGQPREVKYIRVDGAVTDLRFDRDHTNTVMKNDTKVLCERRETR